MTVIGGSSWIQPLHVAFVDLKAAFDSVDLLALWKALRGIGTPQYLLQLIEDLHNGSKSRVRIGATLSPSFISTSGVRQGCVLTPALFCRATDWIMERVASRTGFLLGNDHFTDLDYADDVVLFAHKMDDIHSAWRFLRQQRRNSAYMYLGRRRRFRISVRVNLHLA